MNKRKREEAELEAQINPKELARKMRGEQTIADIACSDDEEDSDFEPEGGKGGNDDVQPQLVRPATLRPQDQLELAAKHDPFRPHAEAEAARRHRETKKRAPDPKLHPAKPEDVRQWLEDQMDKIYGHDELHLSRTRKHYSYEICGGRLQCGLQCRRALASS